MVKNIYKEGREKLELKREGHSLIDRIKQKGYSKDQVYLMLAEELGVEERHAHFGPMNTMRELKPAVEALQRILDKVPKTKYAYKGSKPRIKAEIAANIVRVKDQKKLVSVTTVPKKLSSKQRSKGITLPRKQVLEALEQMKRDRELREQKTARVISTEMVTFTLPVGFVHKQSLFSKIKRFLWR